MCAIHAQSRAKQRSLRMGCACDFCKAKHREPQAERRRKKGRCQQCVPASRDPRGKIATRAEEADGSPGLRAGKTSTPAETESNASSGGTMGTAATAGAARAA